ncbi:heme-binding protein [Pedobacter sp. N36a]|nr:heme-binding protein [Pedobacter sp. N36a]
MKQYLKLILFLPLLSFGQSGENKAKLKDHSANPALTLSDSFFIQTEQLTLKAATELSILVRQKALELNKQVCIAIVDSSGQIIILSRGDGVGPHNTEAARRKAFSSLSTKTSTLSLARNAKLTASTENLAHLPELLLLGGGVPLYHHDKIIGAVGVAGGGSPENDDQIARAAQLLEADLIAK